MFAVRVRNYVSASGYNRTPSCGRHLSRRISRSSQRTPSFPCLYTPFKSSIAPISRVHWMHVDLSIPALDNATSTAPRVSEFRSTRARDRERDRFSNLVLAHWRACARGCRPKLVREIRAVHREGEPGRDIEMRRAIADTALSSSSSPFRHSPRGVAALFLLSQ